MNNNETLKVIKQRRSIRAYKPGQIKKEELQAIVEAGLYAPNAGDQAWHFTVVQNRVLQEKINRLAKEVAKQMDMDHFIMLGNDPHFDCLYGAPTLIIISADKSIPFPLDADCAAATQNLLLAAESMGIGSCWIYFALMAFHSPEGAALLKELQIPEGYRPYDAAVFGYKADDAVHIPERKPGLINFIR